MKKFFGVFILSLISRLYLISKYTWSVPDSDQWRVDINQMFVPIKTHSFHLINLWIPFSEHRLVFQRLYDLLLFNIIGIVNNKLQCIITAIAFSGVLAFLGYRLAKIVQNDWLIALACFLIGIIPFGWESTTSAFQTQTYFYIAAIIGSCWLFSIGKFKWGCITAFLGTFTIATGFISVVGFGIFLFLQFIRDTKTRINFLELSMKESILIIIVILGICIAAKAPFNDSLKSTSLSQTFQFVCMYMAWPCYFIPAMVLVNIIPISILFALWCQKRVEGNLITFLFTFWITILIQAIILSYEKANSHSIFISRYQDEFAPLLMINIISSILIWKELFYEKFTLTFINTVCAISVIVGFVSIINFCNKNSLFWAAKTKQIIESNTVAAYLNPDPEMFYKLVPDKRAWPGKDLNHQSEIVTFCSWMKDTNYTSLVPALVKHPRNGKLIVTVMY